MNLSKLYVAPIKSCKLVPRTELLVGSDGQIKHDHEYMIVEKSTLQQVGQKVSGGVGIAVPEIIQMDIRINCNGSLSLFHPHMGTEWIRVAPPTHNMNPLLNLKVWKNSISGREISFVVSEWITQLISHWRPGTYMLVKVDKKTRLHKYAGQPVGSVDSAPLLVCSQASLDYLNQQFSDGFSIGFEQFRPNIVVDQINLSMHAEDLWGSIRIGHHAEFEKIKLCARCVMIDIDQSTGRIFENKPVMSALRKYRLLRTENKPGIFFGVYHGVKKPGVIKIGDSIHVLPISEKAA